MSKALIHPQTAAQIKRLHYFWLRHTVIVAVGMLLALSISLLVVVPDLYRRTGWFIGTLTSYLFIAYLLLPLLWWLYERYLSQRWHAGRTQTHAGIPSDPLNVGLIGYKSQVVRAMLTAGWVPADKITLRSSLRIAESVVLNRPYPQAPVSDLYLMSRQQDLAFEREIGKSARVRHHVRLWRTKHIPGHGYLWIGAASLDAHAGISHLTGQVTHHIDGKVDREREQLITDLKQAHCLRRVSRVRNRRLDKHGRNAGGDSFQTDGYLEIALLT